MTKSENPRRDDDSWWQERFHATLRAAVDAVIIIDARGTIETVNAAAEKMFGYLESEMVGQNVNILMPEPFSSEHDGFLERYLGGGEAKIIGIGREVVGRRKDGSLFPMDLAVGEGQRDGSQFFVGLVRDLTARRELEGRLHQREEELRWVHDYGLAATATLDLEGRFRVVNRACCELFGGSESDLLGRPFVELSHPDDLESSAAAVASLLSGEETLIRMRHRCLNRRGELVYGSLHLSAIHDADGRPIRLVVQVFDRSDQVRAERGLRESQERLAHVNRLSTLGEMAAGIAHEVNQPLGAISNYAQALRLRLERNELDQDRVAEILGKISAQAHRAGEVIRRLRRLATRHETGRRSLDVNTLIRDILPLAELEARFENVPIELDLELSLPPTAIDEVQIQQVVLNLMRNGIESMAEAEIERPTLEVWTRCSEGSILVEVADRGQGVAADLEGEILTPFVSSKDTGMGLGLSICQSIVTAHGGELGFDSREGGGAVFFFTLPIDTEVENVADMGSRERGARRLEETFPADLLPR